MVRPETLTSICKALTPSAVPATLKSISPWWSSGPARSVITPKSFSGFFSSATKSPIAIPDTGFFIFTPASIKAKVEPQTEAIEVEPLEDKISVTTLMV